MTVDASAVLSSRGLNNTDTTTVRRIFNWLAIRSPAFFTNSLVSLCNLATEHFSWFGSSQENSIWNRCSTGRTSGIATEGWLHMFPRLETLKDNASGVSRNRIIKLLSKRAEFIWIHLSSSLCFRGRFIKISRDEPRDWDSSFKWWLLQVCLSSFYRQACFIRTETQLYRGLGNSWLPL